ncbi:MAG: ATP-dependent Clp protease ATP-binding subunit [Candidatus Saccharibacteria bacterium]|nr:ATP-dependent Clp protease ATP-binding subunit [Candidatus Saccharibacteria bacterium]
MTETVTYNYHSQRANDARVAKAFSRPIRFALVLAMLLLLIIGLLLIFILRSSSGWFVASLTAIPALFYVWWSLYLGDIPPRKAFAIDAQLEGNVLGLLQAKPTPQDIGKAVSKSSGGQFFSARFGIGPTFLGELASNDINLTPQVWQTAVSIKEQQKLNYISSAVLVAALVETHPSMQQVLNHLHLEQSDVVAGVTWYHRLQELIALQKKPKRTGGVGRDLAFGYMNLIKRFGINISEQIAHGGLLSVDIDSHTGALDQMIKTFSSKGRQNIALIGPTGAGKTTLVHAFAEKLLDGGSKINSSLKFRQVIMLDPSALISAAPGRGQIEGLINQVLVEAYKAKNVIVCLDDAHLFFEDGVGSVDISNILLPVLEGGGLRIVLTMDEQKYLQISQRKPSLANALNRVVVGEASKPETIRVMQDQLILTEFSSKVTYTYQSLLEAYRLSERYVHELAMPGRAFKLLESAAGYSDGGLVTAQSVQNTIEQTMNIKVGVASGQDERDKLLNLENKIHERMINQTRAVSVVSDALRRARAGVRNENRPIGTFLFLGPTGVGKTELSKALADVYFGGEDKIARIDMNEYVKADDVSRLIADGADDPNSLTAQVMKQPFSVVLLDEIEKAHPNVLTTLLQLLDEGILRDIKNREVSFRDAIIIATSNAGADRIRQHIEAGEQLEQFEDQFTNELISSNQFKPEFLNRFDEIVLFRPLEKQELLQVIDLILKGVNKNMALQKITVTVDDDAKQLLVEQGYDPRLGARPMRRVVQRSVENLVAKTMLGGNVQPGSIINVTRADIEAAGNQRKAPTSNLVPPQG